MALPTGSCGATPSGGEGRRRPADAAAPDFAEVTARLRAAGCVFAEEEARLLAAAASTPDELAALVRRRATGTPLEQVVGWVEFAGLRVAVEAGVFVPRQRTTFLVTRALAELRARSSGRPARRRPARDARSPTETATAEEERHGPVVVDLCCGTGAVGAALATALGATTRLHATDVDPVAVRCATRNVTAAGHGTVHHGDLYQALPTALRGAVDLLVANAPYVPSDEVALLPREAREHEPRVALDGGPDGLTVQRRVIAESPAWLTRGGVLLMEASARQAPETAGEMRRHGLSATVTRSPDGEATVVVGRFGGDRPRGRRSRGR